MPRIQDIERIWVDLPIKDIPWRNMVRENPHWSLFEVCKVTLDNGAHRRRRDDAAITPGAR